MVESTVQNRYLDVRIVRNFKCVTVKGRILDDSLAHGVTLGETTIDRAVWYIAVDREQFGLYRSSLILPTYDMGEFCVRRQYATLHEARLVFNTLKKLLDEVPRNLA